MSHRKLTALVAVAGAALAVLGLAGCESKVGTAAVVGGHEISDSTVSQYLTPQAKPFTVSSGSGASQTIVPRSYVLGVLIRERVLTATLAATKGGVPSESELDTTRAQLAQGATDEQQDQGYTRYGFASGFAKLDLRDSALEAILAQRVGATSDAGPLLAAIDKADIDVTVSGRYGTWEAKQLSVSAKPSDGAPSFVSLPHASYANLAPALPAS